MNTQRLNDGTPIWRGRIVWCENEGPVKVLGWDHEGVDVISLEDGVQVSAAWTTLRANVQPTLGAMDILSFWPLGGVPYDLEGDR
jgi:hypothetical protein